MQRNVEKMCYPLKVYGIVLKIYFSKSVCMVFIIGFVIIFSFSNLIVWICEITF